MNGVSDSSFDSTGFVTVQLNDEPSLALDLIPARISLVRRLAQDVRRCQPPEVYGIHGDWGSGKTGFLQRLQYELAGECGQNSEGETLLEKEAERAEHEKEGRKDRRRPSEPVWWTDRQLAWKQVVPIWFEAWRYQNEAAPIVALLQEMRSQLSHSSKIMEFIGKTAEVTLRGALLSIESITKKIGLQASKVEKAGEDWEKRNLAEALPSNQLRDLLDKTLAELLGSEMKPGKALEDTLSERRVVIFIDDLDRCDPATAVRLLDGLKIYLNLRRCVIVLAFNYEQIKRAVASALPVPAGAGPQGALAQEYIEKLCGHVVRLPLLDNVAQRQLVSGWLKGHAKANRNVALAFAVEMRRLIEVYEFLPANARRIKAWCNTLLRLYHRRQWQLWLRGGGAPGDGADEKWREVDPPAAEAVHLAILACFQQFHPELFHIVESEPEFYEELRSALLQSDQPDLSEARKTLLGKVGRLPFKVKVTINPSTSLPDPPVYISEFADPASLDVFHCLKLVIATALTPGKLKDYLSESGSLPAAAPVVVVPPSPPPAGS